jgi:hypothetical protein
MTFSSRNALTTTPEIMFYSYLVALNQSSWHITLAKSSLHQPSNSALWSLYLPFLG